MAIVIKQEDSSGIIHDEAMSATSASEDFLVPLEDPLTLDQVNLKHEHETENNTEFELRQMTMEIEAYETKPAVLKDNAEMLECGELEIAAEMDQEKLGDDGKSLQRKKRTPTCFICTICHVGFHEKDLLLQHTNTIHPDVFKYPCRHCGKKFQKLQQKNIHETIHDKRRFEGEPFACDQCDNKYHIKASLRLHIKKVHLGYKYFQKSYSAFPVTQHHAFDVRPPPKERVKKMFQCDKCDLKFDMRCHLRKHMIVHSDARAYNCSICGQGCKTRSSLRTHMRTVHENVSTGPRPSRPKFMSGKPCPCPTCGKVYRLPTQLQRHLRTHTGEKPYVCNICGFSCALLGGLKSHQQQRHFRNQMLMFKCARCGKEMPSFASFTTHIRSHNPVVDGRAFGCSICGKPHFTRARAAVCTVFGHDPSPLLRDMFQFKCCECPSERFGYHSLIALRKHWSLEHVNIPLPTKYRAGMYDGNGSLRKEDDDVLPKVVIPKAEADKLRETGIPPVKLEYPLFVELEDKTEELPKNNNRGKNKKNLDNLGQIIMIDNDERILCPKCPMVFCSRGNLKRHMRTNAHVSRPVKPFKRRKTRNVQSPPPSEDFVENDLELSQSSEVELKELRIKLRRVDDSPRMTEDIKCNDDDKVYENATVDVNDKNAIRSLLGNKVLKVQVCRLKLLVSQPYPFDQLLLG